MNIEYWRTEIDEIDRELLRLLNRRARLAIKVGVLKSAAGLPCCDPERERLILGRIKQTNPGPLDHDAVTKLFRRIIRESRKVEMLSIEGLIESNSTVERQPSKNHERVSSGPYEPLSGEGVLV